MKYAILKAVYQDLHTHTRVEWRKVGTVDAHSPEDAIKFAKRLGHVGPVVAPVGSSGEGVGAGYARD